MDLIERPYEFTSRHPWEVARARFFLRLLDRLGCIGSTAAWLDVGAGDAWFAGQLRAVLPSTARLVCWDVHYGDTELAAPSPEPGPIVFTAERPSGTFDGVMMLDVIEHVEDDVAFVRDVVSHSLAARGWVLVSVPAYQRLFSDHDRALKHYRRYSPRALRLTLESAGLSVVARGGLFHALVAHARRHRPARASPGPAPSPDRHRRMAGHRTAVAGPGLRPRHREPAVAGHGLAPSASCARLEHVGSVPTRRGRGRRRRQRRPGEADVTGEGFPVIVVPCYNEQHRLDEGAFLEMAGTRELRLLFVDDGSTDDTASILARLAQASEGIEVLSLAANRGKAEAVRQGLLAVVHAGAGVVGYYDADLATPPGELARLTATLAARPELAGVFGCRVARLGSSIERRALRHYLGRAYATLASMALGITVYDTQCGAKVFRVNETLVDALARPFASQWALDVELLHRLLRGSPTAPGLPVTAFAEIPLEVWLDVGGSKLHLGPAARALTGLVGIARSRRAFERAGHAAPTADRGSDAGDAPLRLARPQSRTSPPPRTETKRKRA